MKFTNRKEAYEFYKDILFDAQLTNCVPQVMSRLGRRDLFFLLVFLLNRKDVDRDWLFERCQEVQNGPNGYLDLWAREHYKSTIITYGKTIQDILDSHSEDSYYWDQEVTVGIFSHTRPIAKAFLTQIMFELEFNIVLHDLYPDVLWRYPRKEASKWSLDSGIVVKRKSNPKEATVEAWGLVDGQPVSKHFLILNFDDIVTKESISTPDQIKKTTDALALAFNLGVIDKGKKRFIGTHYHFNDSYKEMLKRKTAIPRIYPATKDGTVEGEPVLMSKEALMEKRRDMGPYIFSCQMLLDPKADEVQGFKQEWFEYWNPANYSEMNRYILVDPASEKKKGSDYTIMWVIGLNEDKNYYVIDGVRDRLNLTERAKWLFKLHRLYRPIGVGYEKYGMQADIEHIEFVMDLENYRFNITPLGGSVPKNDRIRGMIPIFEQGRMYLPYRLMFIDREKKVHDLTIYMIEDELLAFPVSQYDDGMDCLARILDSDLNVQFPALKEKAKGLQPENRVAQTDYPLFGGKSV